MVKALPPSKNIIVIKDLINGTIEVMSSEPTKFIYCIKRAKDDLDIVQYGEGKTMDDVELVNVMAATQILDKLTSDLAREESGKRTNNN